LLHPSTSEKVQFLIPLQGLLKGMRVAMLLLVPMDAENCWLEQNMHKQLKNTPVDKKKTFTFEIMVVVIVFDPSVS